MVNRRMCGCNNQPATKSPTTIPTIVELSFLLISHVYKAITKPREKKIRLPVPIGMDIQHMISRKMTKRMKVLAPITLLDDNLELVSENDMDNHGSKLPPILLHAVHELASNNLLPSNRGIMPSLHELYGSWA